MEILALARDTRNLLQAITTSTLKLFVTRFLF